MLFQLLGGANASNVAANVAAKTSNSIVSSASKSGGKGMKIVLIVVIVILFIAIVVFSILAGLELTCTTDIFKFIKPFGYAPGEECPKKKKKKV